MIETIRQLPAAFAAHPVATLTTFGGLVLVHLVELWLIRWVLISRIRTPAASVAWVMAIVFIPYLGGLLFVIFGINRVERRKAERVEATGKLCEARGQFDGYTLSNFSDLPERSREAAQTVERVSGFRPTVGNLVEILHDTHRTLGLIEQAVTAAESHIHLEYYIWEPDETGVRLRNALIAAAERGVKVRFLYDAFGSMFLRSRFFEPMREAGIEVATFLPGQSFRDRWSINLRSHRKIVVVDGRVGFTGGMNIGDEYLGKVKKYGSWRDCHLRVEGPAALQLQRVFAEDWQCATFEDLTGPDYFPETRRHEGGVVAQVVAGGPDVEPRLFHALFFAAINEAERQITLTTGYFIPTEPLAMALESAAVRGVDVRLLVPGRSAHFFPYTVWAGRSYYDRLLEAGCTIHEFTAGIMHAKMLTIDGGWSLIGSPNLDARSCLLNFEVGCILHGREAAESIERQYERDLSGSEPVSLEERHALSPGRRVRENFMRMFAPVM